MSSWFGIRAVKKALDREYRKLGENISSALFRRWIRLYIPVVCSTFINTITLHLFKIHALPDLKTSYHDELRNWFVAPAFLHLILSETSEVMSLLLYCLVHTQVRDNLININVALDRST